MPAFLPATQSGGDEAQPNDGDKPAWVDSDDERNTVSLASNPRLRKLRITESEDIINGKEYAKRLRRQFERLHPVPEWANPSPTRRSSHKDRPIILRISDSSEAVASGDDTTLGSEDLSTQPLTKLLQNVGSLTQDALAELSHQKRLRPEVIDIHRTKDVGLVQPVSPACSVPAGTTNDIVFYLVCHNISRFPPFTPTLAKLWACLHTLAASHLSTSTQSKPPAHNTPLTIHSSNNDRFSSHVRQ